MKMLDIVAKFSESVEFDKAVFISAIKQSGEYDGIHFMDILYEMFKIQKDIEGIKQMIYPNSLKGKL